MNLDALHSDHAPAGIILNKVDEIIVLGVAWTKSRASRILSTSVLPRPCPAQLIAYNFLDFHAGKGNLTLRTAEG